MNVWLVLITIGVVTFSLRTLPLLVGGLSSSGRFDDLRRFVPVAALTALIVPALLPRAGEPAGLRAMAAVVALLCAWRFRNMLVPVVAGLVTYWLLGWTLA